jgi:hypothetical protein
MAMRCGVAYIIAEHTACRHGRGAPAAIERRGCGVGAIGRIVCAFPLQCGWRLI